MTTYTFARFALALSLAAFALPAGTASDDDSSAVGRDESDLSLRASKSVNTLLAAISAAKDQG